MKVGLSVLFLAVLNGTATALFWKNYIYVNSQLKWNAAQAYCRRHFVDLLTIETQAEDDKYQNKMQPNCYKGCWIGLSRKVQTMNFTQWSDGCLVNFNNWDGNEPSNMNNANCVYASKYWHNDDCTSARSFICYEWKPDLIVVTEMMTWQEALKYCRMNYTDLVSLVTQEDQLAVNSKSQEILTASFWTGLRFLDGSWFWVIQASTPTKSPGNLRFMPSCPAKPFHCGAQETESDVLENRNCEEKMNFICYVSYLNAPDISFLNDQINNVTCRMDE